MERALSLQMPSPPVEQLHQEHVNLEAHDNNQELVREALREPDPDQQRKECFERLTKYKFILPKALKYLFNYIGIGKLVYTTFCYHFVNLFVNLYASHIL